MRRSRRARSDCGPRLTRSRHSTTWKPWRNERSALPTQYTYMQILLISNSTLYQRGYLDHVADRIQPLFAAARRIVFVPYALFDRDAYGTKAEQRFRELGLELSSLHRTNDPRAAVAACDGIFIGGGNTFRLLDSLYLHDLLELIRDRVRAGVPYIRSGAGAKVGGPPRLPPQAKPRAPAAAPAPLAHAGSPS